MNCNLKTFWKDIVALVGYRVLGTRRKRKIRKDEYAYVRAITHVVARCTRTCRHPGVGTQTFVSGRDNAGLVRKCVIPEQNGRNKFHSPDVTHTRAHGWDTER